MFQFRVDKLNIKLFVPPEADWLARWIVCAIYKMVTAHVTPRHLEPGKLHLSVRHGSQKSGGMNALWRY